MNIPPPPPVVPLPPAIFAGTEKKREDADLGKLIRDLLTKMLKITYVPGWQEMLIRYRAVINPGTVVDVNKLPYPATSPNQMVLRGKEHMPLACLYTRLSWTLLSYWRLCVDGAGDADTVLGYVRELDELISHTDERGNQLHLQQVLLRCDVVGDNRTGYQLEWRGTLGN